MAKFKKGDKVVFNGSISEMFYRDFVVGKEYEVLRYYDRGELVVKNPDEPGAQMVYMKEDNFELSTGVHKNQHKLGDRVVITARDGLLGSHMYEIGTEVIITDTALARRGTLDGVSTEYYDTVPVGGGTGWYIHDGECELVTPELAKDENDYQLETGRFKLKTATVLGKGGERVTIKRSKCRHYYLKSDSIKQKRITKAEAAELLTEVVNSI